MIKRYEIGFRDSSGIQRSGRWALLALLAPGISLAAPASGKTTWTTFLYAGPGYRHPVVDEVPQATTVEVSGCENGWCRVTIGRRTGFVRAEIVATDDHAASASSVLPQPAAANRQDPKGPCFEVNQTGGNGGNALTRVCGR